MPTSHPEFNDKTTATEVASEFSDQIKDKIVIITGVGPDSLGEALALSIGSQGPARLILASRTKSKVQQVADKVLQLLSNLPIDVIELDLASQKSIHAAASKVKSLVEHIDILINNAGIITQERELTEEGIELQFGTNHVGTFLFTHLLMLQLKTAAKLSTPGSTRVVNVSSAGHRLSPIRFHDYNFDGKEIPDDEKPPENLPPMYNAKAEGYNPWLAYGQSKGANVLFTVYLTRHLASEGILSYAVHPGSIHTGLGRKLNEADSEVMDKTSKTWRSADQGASTMVVAAFDPALTVVSDPTAIYLSDCQLATAAPPAVNLDNAEKLHKLSEELVGQEFQL